MITTWTETKTTIRGTAGDLVADAHELKVDHGMRDEKGRAIGGNAMVRQHYEYDPETGTATLSTQWVVFVNAARNGRDYGASTRGTVVATLDAAKSLAERKLADQRARYAKSYTKAEAA